MTDSAHALHILVVEGAPEIARLLEIILRREGHQVTIATRVLPLALVRELAPDLIIHDLIFGRQQQTVWYFLRELRHDPVLGTVPVLLCSTVAETVTHPPTVAELHRLGVDVLVKPFSLGALVQRVSRVRAAQALEPGRRASALGSIDTVDNPSRGTQRPWPPQGSP